MTTMGIINLIIINAMIWVGLSYFWSFWTHKLFKPWGWLELRKRKMVNAEVDKAERRCKDRVRFYAHFFAMQQVEQNETEGAFVVASVEEPLILRTLRNQCPNRALWALGPMEETTVTIVHENCQGEVSEEQVKLDWVSETEVQSIMPSSSDLNHVLNMPVPEALPQLTGSIALASIDLVDHDTLLATLRHIYPLLSPGAVLLVHSYDHSWPGVRKAVDTFSASIPEGFLELPDMYGSVALVRNRSKS